MTAHAFVGRHGVSLAAPPSLRLAGAIGLAPEAPPPVAAPAALPPAPPPLPRTLAAERMQPRMRSTLAALAQAPGPIFAADLRRVIGGGLESGTLTSQLARLAEWGLAARQGRAEGGRLLWQVTDAGRAFVAASHPPADFEILQAVRVMARTPATGRCWWTSAEPRRPDQPTTAYRLGAYFRRQGSASLTVCEARVRLAQLAAAGLILRGTWRRNGVPQPCYWPLHAAEVSA